MYNWLYLHVSTITIFNRNSKKTNRFIAYHYSLWFVVNINRMHCEQSWDGKEHWLHSRRLGGKCCLCHAVNYRIVENCAKLFVGIDPNRREKFYEIYLCVFPELTLFLNLPSDCRLQRLGLSHVPKWCRPMVWINSIDSHRSSASKIGIKFDNFVNFIPQVLFMRYY